MFLSHCHLGVYICLLSLFGQLRLNQQTKEESQDSLLSLHVSEAAEDRLTSGSERLMDSESHSGWGSDEDAARNRASSSASPGPSYTDGK